MTVGKGCRCKLMLLIKYDHPGAEFVREYHFRLPTAREVALHVLQQWILCMHILCIKQSHLVLVDIFGDG